MIQESWKSSVDCPRQLLDEKTCFLVMEWAGECRFEVRTAGAQHSDKNSPFPWLFAGGEGLCVHRAPIFE